MSTIDVIVQGITLASASSRTFELRPRDGTLPPFAAGAHIDVHVRPGLIRQYSLCNAPGERHRYLICVKREPAGRGGSAAMHDGVSVGERLTISMPRNTFAVSATAARHVLVGGGIGITPLLAMAHALDARDARFDLHHYTPTPADSPLLETIRAAPFGERAIIHHSSDGDSLRGGLPATMREPDPAAAVYVCGPDGMTAHLHDLAVAAGWDPGQIHTERFAPLVPAGPREGDGTFAVRIASTDQRIVVPADRTIAEMLTEHGIDVELACEQGICGACLTPVLAGEPEHRDEVQTADEHAANAQITICCSRSRSAELTLGI